MFGARRLALRLSFPGKVLTRAVLGEKPVLIAPIKSDNLINRRTAVLKVRRYHFGTEISTKNIGAGRAPSVIRSQSSCGFLTGLPARHGREARSDQARLQSDRNISLVLLSTNSWSAGRQCANGGRDGRRTVLFFEVMALPASGFGRVEYQGHDLLRAVDQRHSACILRVFPCDSFSPRIGRRRVRLSGCRRLDCLRLRGLQRRRFAIGEGCSVHPHSVHDDCQLAGNCDGRNLEAFMLGKPHAP